MIQPERFLPCSSLSVFEKLRKESSPLLSLYNSQPPLFSSYVYLSPQLIRKSSSLLISPILTKNIFVFRFPSPSRKPLSSLSSSLAPCPLLSYYVTVSTTTIARWWCPSPRVPCMLKFEEAGLSSPTTSCHLNGLAWGVYTIVCSLNLSFILFFNWQVLFAWCSTFLHL